MLRHRNIIIILLLIALVFILFGKTLEHGFNSDDYLVIYHAAGSTYTPLEAAKEFLRPSWGLYYRPLIITFFEIMENWFGAEARGYHLVSLLLYSVLCIQVYVLGMLLTRRMMIALGAALLFMTMTAHAQAIFWISSLNGVVENAFSLASLIFFIWWRVKPRRALYFLSLMLFVAALFLKESAVSLPLVLILYDALLGGEFKWPQTARRIARSTWPFILLAALFVGLRSIIMRQVQLPPPLTGFHWKTAITGLWHTLLMTLSPIDWALTVTWYNKLEAGGLLFYLFAALLLFAIAGAPVLLRKHRAAFLLGWIVIGAIPVILLGLAPSERHLVFSSAAAAILIALVMFRVGDIITRRVRIPSWAGAYGFVFIFCATSFFYLNQRRETWKVASDLAGGIVAQTVAAYPAPPPDTTFFFFNVPDTYDGAFVFRFENLSYALRLFYREPSINAVRIVASERIPAGILADETYAYFRISAMGGNVFAGGRDSPSGSSRIREIEFLSKNSYYSDNWPRYSTSPFLIYSQGRLIPSRPEELKAILGELYSVH